MCSWVSKEMFCKDIGQLESYKQNGALFGMLLEISKIFIFKYDDIFQTRNY